MNSGAKIFLFILIGCLVLLILTLVFIGVFSKGKKIKGGAKFIVILLSLMTTTSFILFPLSYHNCIDVNVRYGYFKSVDEKEEIKITRHACEYNPFNGSIQNGTWSLKNDELTLYLSGGTQKYTVKGMGTEFYVGDQLTYRYMTGKQL